MVEIEIRRGVEYVVVHLATGDGKYRWCQPIPYEPPPQNDKRPRVLCSGCGNAASVMYQRVEPAI